MPTQKSLKYSSPFPNLYQHPFISEIQKISESYEQSGHTHLRLTHPKTFQLIVNFHELVLSMKKSGYSILLFQRYSLSQNTAI